MKEHSNKITLKKIIGAGIIIFVVCIVVSVIKGLQDPYTQDILNYRKQKDEHFKTNKNSPIEDQVNFKALSYFEPDEDYCVKPILSFIKDSSFVTIINNDGEKNKYWRFASAIFTISDRKDTLIIYRKASLKPEDKNYFLPFFDETNGKETYTGGRYLDLEINDTTAFRIDFNLAYNPYCIYNYRFSCPVPPAENKVNGRIEAGEREYLK